MRKIPILFIKDDDILIEMYKDYFESRGYRSILIRGGKEGLEEAFEEGPSLATFDIQTLTKGEDSSLILIFTYSSRKRYEERPEITSAVISSDVFNKIENSLNPIF